MDIDRVTKAKEILSNIRYVTIASASSEAAPWGTPVLAVFDDQYNCYWTSLNNTQHSQNIQENPRVYLTCFDSTVLPGEGGGVYVQAQAAEMTDPVEITHAAELLYARKNKSVRKAEEFLGDSPKRMYKAIPQKFWINLDVDVKNDPMRAKKEIILP
jgi:nitroimidazol reductase NimA-like FMN-containing flavoprotein (pyridoxamine 5'-phosphate oxidase superfamily)